MITGSELSIDQAIDFLALNRRYLDNDHRERLKNELHIEIEDEKPSILLGDDPDIDPEQLDLLYELKEQLHMVRHLRQLIKIRGNDVEPRELKDLISTTTSLISMITKLHERVLNQDRIRRIESAVVKTAEALSEEVREVLFLELERNLAE